MLLAIDIGNTNLTVGAFHGERLLSLWRLATDAKKTADEYGASLRGLLAHAGHGEAQAVVYASVVPALNPVIEAASRAYLGRTAQALDARTSLGIRLKVDEPGEVGSDRVLNALAALRLYGGPAVVIDFGTATTFDCVSARGEYLGGAILIGPKVAAAALARYTAKLPLAEVRKTRRVIGKSTVECIQAGLYYGYLGMLERVLTGTLAEMRQRARGRRPKVIATGGLAGLFASEMPQVLHVVPELTLQGIRLGYEILRGMSGKRRKQGTKS